MGTRLRITKLQNLCLNRVIPTTLYYSLKLSHKKKNYRVRYTREDFNLELYSNEECLVFFRFTKSEIYLLQRTLKIPAENRLENHTRFSGLEGFCLLLRRLSTPNRLSDLVDMFHRDEGTLSKIITFMLNFMYDRHAKRLHTLKQNYLTVTVLQELANNSFESGCPYPNIVGYIDGTCRPICRPIRNQKQYYSGYKRAHVVKYQSVVLSNGLIGRLDGPFIGRRHDAAIVHLTKILQEMKVLFTNSDGTYWALYGDIGYANQKFIKVGFKNYAQLTPKQKNFNKTVSALRVSVEYGFGKIVQQFSFLDYRKTQKLYLCPLKKMYYVAGFLVNCQTCMRGENQISELFKSYVPTLEEYMA